MFLISERKEGMDNIHFRTKKEVLHTHSGNLGEIEKNKINKSLNILAELAQYFPIPKYTDI